MKERPFRGKNLKGKRFSRLVVVSIDSFYRCPKNPKYRMVMWKCLCDCGQFVVVPISRLASGNTRSCGCLKSDLLRKLKTKHGHRPHWSKGKPHHLYDRWQGMIQRCVQPRNKAYRWYGARGIKVCKRWRNFQLFLDDMEAGFKPGLTIERKNNNLDYCSSNCRWATWKEQRDHMFSLRKSK